MTTNRNNAIDASDLVLTQLELRLLAGGDDADPTRSQQVLGVEPLSVELAIDAYASLALRGLAEYSGSDVLIAPPVSEAIRIMATSSESLRLGVVSESAAASAIFFDGPEGRLAVSPSEIPGCRILTKLVHDEPLAAAVSRMVLAVAPAEGDVAAALELFTCDEIGRVGVRRHEGRCETVAAHNLNGAGEALVSAITDALSAPATSQS